MSPAPSMHGAPQMYHPMYQPPPGYMPQHGYPHPHAGYPYMARQDTYQGVKPIPKERTPEKETAQE